ncbi:HTH-type transcriptional repressor AseR [Poriferisphaera corsica]|uniref:HTH-type transcriptional repressor AseR n=1 Tax=Poriferisphaera corsica TaxID=2528020 RepID=A0A517YT33_9BACT|nr:metalloregulator ArsR/SmtB family transcription factor [Poriferisphaera corsica]QDU33386.1 HTH-type transcriptional repressor AseR [Poriferisphaera corsica]
MQQFTQITKALSDPTRLRALMTLTDGELCLCQIIDILHLAPSTVSKHMNLLHDAGFLQKRKQGKWQYYKLNPSPTSPAKQLLKLTISSLESEPQILTDRKTRKAVIKQELEVTCECYNR